jgi:esterase/lipase superfamily enzyme
MIRVLLPLAIALFALFPTLAHANTPSNWIKITTIEIDTRKSGTRTVDLSAITGSFRALRLKSERPVSGLLVTTRALNEAIVTRSIAIAAATPSEHIFTSGSASFINGIDLQWTADPAAPGPVQIEIWGQQTAVEAAAKRPSSTHSATGTAGTRGGATGDVPESAPKPRSTPRSATPMPAPSPAPSPTIGAPPPTTAPPRPVAGGTRGMSDDAPAAASGAAACVAQNVCTAVDVFFGTDRVKTAGLDRISFDGNRAYPATPVLGKTIVTIPRAKRETGTITRPWQERYLGVTMKGDPAVHFTIPDNGVKVYADEAAFLADVKANIANGGAFKDHAFIYVHGFGVTFENAMYRAAQISYDLSTDGRPFGTAFVYTWPSAGKTDPFSYGYDIESADGAAKHLLAFVELVTQKTGVANVHVIAHSMGNRVLVRAFDRAPSSGLSTKLNQIILAAPDYDKKQFEEIVQGVTRSAKNVTLYASSKDAALALSSKTKGYTPRAGEVRQPPGPALASGMDTIDISALSTAIFSVGHEYFADSKELLADMRILLTTPNAHPPTARNKLNFETLREGNFQYWKYKSGA